MSEFDASRDPRTQQLINWFEPSNLGGTSSFTKGGKIPLLNRKLFYVADSLRKNIRKISDDLLSDVYRFARSYISGDFSNLWLRDIEIDGSNTDNDELSFLLENNFSFLLNLISGSVEQIFIDKEGEIPEYKKRRFEPSEEIISEVRKKLFKVIEEDRLEDFIKNPVVAKISEKRFNFDFYNTQISNLVSNRIREDRFRFNIPVWLYNQFIKPSSAENSEDRFNQYWTIPASSNKVLDNILKTEYIGVINAGVEPPPSKVKGVGTTQSLQWPDVITKNPLAPYAPEVPNSREVLEDFKSLENTNISTYQFQYLKQIEPDYFVNSNFFGVSGNFIIDLFTGGQKTTNETIEISLKNSFTLMIMRIMEDLRADGDLDQSVGKHFDEALNDSRATSIIEEITNFILIDKEIARRIQFWNEISTFDDDGVVTEEEQEEALASSLDAWAAGEATGVEVLSEEDIEKRKKFFKQCALMMNLPQLRTTYDSELKKRYDGKKLYLDRFYMAYCEKDGQEKLLSNLLTSADEQKLLEIPAHVLSSLVPKIRLFKVMEQGDKVTNTEFIFDATSKINRPEAKGRTAGTSSRATNFLSEEFDKGAGCGLKEFSFEFNGTNPAEARNDIKATLKLYFQSFNDFIRFRKAKDGSTYRYVDLIIQPDPDSDSNKIMGREVVSNRQYDPSFYRIRADVGYYTDGIEDETLKKTILVSNKSLFLNMIDHDIQFKNDGTVEISISYRAYVESLLKHPRLDALASPELIEKRIENAKILANELSKRECSKERIQELQVSIAAVEEVILEKSLSSIIDRLRRRGVIYQVQIKDSDRKQFLSDGFFKKCRLKNSVIIPQKNRKGEYGGRNNADVGVVLNNRLPEKSEDFNFISNSGLVQFFFFGDLLYTILDCVYNSNTGTLRDNSGFSNSKIVLGSFEFDPFQIFESQDKVFNIAQIPISVDFFSRWFVEEVISQKSTRKSFPVLNFIRSLTNQLIKPSLLETCVNRNIDKTLRFQTCQITAYNDQNKDPLKEQNKPTGNKRVGMEVMKLRGDGILPLKGGGDNDENPNNFFNYIVLSTAGSTLSYSGSGKYAEDIKEGRLHVNIGQNNGLIKSISLSKSDQQYIREARFYQQGIDGLLQLSAVYVANLEMFGNTLFYPGMEFFFNPYGLGGGTDFGSPTSKESVANKLGIGGYHTVTSVRSTITPGNFKTTIAGQQYFSGAEEDRSSHLRGTSRKKENQFLESYSPDNLNDAACETVILGVQNFDPEDLETQADSVERPRPEPSNTPTESVTQESYSEAPLESGEFEVGGELIPGEFLQENNSDGSVSILFRYVDDDGEFRVVDTGRFVQ